MLSQGTADLETFVAGSAQFNPHPSACCEVFARPILRVQPGFFVVFLPRPQSRLGFVTLRLVAAVLTWYSRLATCVIAPALSRCPAVCEFGKMPDLRLFLFLTTFGILNIIVGVIVENTLNAAKQNQELQAGDGKRAA